MGSYDVILCLWIVSDTLIISFYTFLYVHPFYFTSPEDDHVVDRNM
jgi:hypothetical protein